MNEEIIKLYREPDIVDSSDKALLFKIIEDENGIIENLEKPVIITSKEDDSVTYEIPKDLEPFEKYGGIKKALELSSSDFVTYVIEKIKNERNLYCQSDGDYLHKIRIVFNISSSIQTLYNFAKFSKISEKDIYRIESCLVENGTDEDIAYLAKNIRNFDPDFLNYAIQNSIKEKQPKACTILADIEEIDKSQFVKIIEEKATSSEVLAFVNATKILTPKMKNIIQNEKAFMPAFQLFENTDVQYTIEDLQQVAIAEKNLHNILICMEQEGADLNLLLKELSKKEMILAYRKQLELGDKVKNIFDDDSKKGQLVNEIVKSYSILKLPILPDCDEVKSSLPPLMLKIIPTFSSLESEVVKMIQDYMINKSNVKSNWIFNIKDADVISIANEFKEYKNKDLENINLEQYWDILTFINGMLVSLNYIKTNTLKENILKKNNISYSIECFNNIKNSIPHGSKMEAEINSIVFDLISIFEKAEGKNGPNTKSIYTTIKELNSELPQYQ